SYGDWSSDVCSSDLRGWLGCVWISKSPSSCFHPRFFRDDFHPELRPAASASLFGAWPGAWTILPIVHGRAGLDENLCLLTRHILWQRSGSLSDISRFVKDVAVETQKTGDLPLPSSGSKKNGALGAC